VLYYYLETRKASTSNSEAKEFGSVYHQRCIQWHKTLKKYRSTASILCESRTDQFSGPTKHLRAPSKWKHSNQSEKQIFFFTIR